MVFLDPHLGAGIDGIQEPLADIGVHLERKIVRVEPASSGMHPGAHRPACCRTCSSSTGYTTIPVEQFEDRTVYGVLDAGPVVLFHDPLQFLQDLLSGALKA